jgi:hypothetical protein
MSFALEYRKQRLTAPPKPIAATTTRPRKTAPKRVETRGRGETQASRATALGALLMAAVILAVFNSEGLRLYAGDLAERQVGRPLLALSEAWDDAMERAGAKALVTRVRHVVTEAREASWADVAGLVGATHAGPKSFAAKRPREEITGSLPLQAKHGINIDAGSVDRFSDQ